MPQTSAAGRNAASTTEQARKHIKEDLGRHFKRFLNKAWPEEIRFMLDVLMTWDAHGGGTRQVREAIEVPIYTAFQANVDGRGLLKVPYPRGEYVLGQEPEPSR